MSSSDFVSNFQLALRKMRTVWSDAQLSLSQSAKQRSVWSWLKNLIMRYNIMSSLLLLIGLDYYRGTGVVH